jgi:hypothetical protein
MLRVLCAAAITLIPTAQAFSGTEKKGWLPEIVRGFDDPAWLAPFILGLVLLVPLQHYHEGAPTRRVLRALARVNGSFAGSLWSFGDKTDATQKRKLDDTQCEAMCAALLHRIRDFTAVALRVDSTRLRATLAVPYSTTGGTIDSLRVWCYDETHGDRGFTVIPVTMDGKVAPGAPAAYLTGAVQIIADILEVRGRPPTQRKLPYRSIVSIPLPARGPDGKPLAVVSIDADEPDFFDPSDVAEDVHPLVSPVVNAIGLVLLSRRKKGQPYEFPR